MANQVVLNNLVILVKWFSWFFSFSQKKFIWISILIKSNSLLSLKKGFFELRVGHSDLRYYAKICFCCTEDAKFNLIVIKVLSSMCDYKFLGK